MCIASDPGHADWTPGGVARGVGRNLSLGLLTVALALI